MGLLERFRRGHGHCVLCGRARANVDQLVAGERGAVCDRCLPYAIAVLDAQGPKLRPLHYTTRTLLRVLADLPFQTPLAESGRALTAAAVLAGDDVDVLREIVAAALRLQHHRAVLDLIGAIPTSARTGDDENDRAVALTRLGRADEAIAALEQLPAETSDVALAARTRLNLAAAVVEVGLDVVRAEAIIADAEAALARLVSSDPAASVWRLPLLTSHARVHLLRGEPARAEALMQAVEAERGTLDAHQRMVLGDALAARSDVRLAHRHWQNALADAHPESLLAEQLRRRLASSGA